MLTPVAMIGIEPLAIILVIVILLFGGQKIPELFRGLGRGVGELQKGLEEGKRTLSNSMKEETPYNPPYTTPTGQAPVTPQPQPQQDPEPAQTAGNAPVAKGS